jgi:hypothetical protein
VADVQPIELGGEVTTMSSRIRFALPLLAATAMLAATETLTDQQAAGTAQQVFIERNCTAPRSIR